MMFFFFGLSMEARQPRTAFPLDHQRDGACLTMLPAVGAAKDERGADRAQRWIMISVF
jgi:hypothetical protein